MSQFLDDPYQPQTPPAQAETIPLDQIIRQGIEAAALQLHTWLPGAVTKVRSNGFVDVQPLLQRTYADGTTVNLPVVQNVMVGTPSGQKWWVRMPLAVGDVGILFFCERSLDIWGVGNTTPATPLDPQDPRHHSLSDAAFIPGLRQANNIVSDSGSASDMVLHNDQAEIVIKPTGKFLIKNLSTGAELLSVLDSVISTLISATVPTGIGPQNFVPSTIAALEAEQTNLEELKG